MKFLALLAAAAVMAAFGAHAAVSSLSLEANAQYLADNAKKPGVIVRPSGLTGGREFSLAWLRR